MRPIDLHYITTGHNILDHGFQHEVRGNTVLSLPNLNYDFDFRAHGFPVLGVKHTYHEMAINEMVGYLRGYTDAYDFRDKLNCPTWIANATENEQWNKSPYKLHATDMGPVYGYQWRKWMNKENGAEHDQVVDILHHLLNRDYNRRLVMTAWNVTDIDQGCLAPCLYAYHFMMMGDTLHLTAIQRSGDYALGVPFNFVQSGFLLLLFATLTGLKAGSIKHIISDCHIYEQHIDTVNTMLGGVYSIQDDLRSMCELGRSPMLEIHRGFIHKTWGIVGEMIEKDLNKTEVSLKFNDFINNFTAKDTTLVNYIAGKKYQFDMAV